MHLFNLPRTEVGEDKMKRWIGFPLRLVLAPLVTLLCIGLAVAQYLLSPNEWDVDFSKQTWDEHFRSLLAWVLASK
jgi:hypothetical protein